MHHKFRLISLAWLFLLFTGPAQAVNQDDLLRPEQAFVISGQAEQADSLRIVWDIADGYYLYKSKIKFSSKQPDVEFGAPVFPPAETKQDDFFGEMEIFRGKLQIDLPIVSNGGQQQLQVEAGSQGCADIGICYPPQRQNLDIALPQTAVGAQSAELAAEKTSRSPFAAIQELGDSLGLGMQEDEILDPEQAYILSTELLAPDRVKVHWSIAEGTYLYQEKIKLSLEGGDGVSFGEYQLPEAKIKSDTARPDGTFGDVAIYQDEISLPVTLLRNKAEATDVTLVVKYQGCADRGICYPPQTQKIELALPAMDPGAVTTRAASRPAAATEAPAAETTAAPKSETDKIADTLRHGSAWLVVASFFGFGLLLALTPCVFPMIPILSGIIAGQGSGITTRKAFTLSLVYVLAMALTYTVAGVLAGLFGENLQAAFQNPWILSFFALVFVALAMSMFGFYELQLPSSLQSKLTEISNKQEGGTLLGVAIMGLLSALIVGPCVAPPLAGALIFIGQTGDWALGGMALFAMSMGMGAPLIAIGTSAGKLLPRAGGWMDTIKAVFGVLMLAVAVVMLERILPAEVAMLLWGALLICSAVYMGALRSLPAEAGGWVLLWKGLGLVLLIYGSLMLIGAAAGGKDTVQPLRGLMAGGAAGHGGQAAHVQFKRIKTLDDLQRELADSARTGQAVMLDFYADWCVSCKEMERYTFSDAGVLQALDGFKLLQADVTENDEQDKALLQGHFGLPGPPAIMFYGPDGEELRHLRVVGFMPADDFITQIKQVQP